MRCCSNWEASCGRIDHSNDDRPTREGSYALPTVLYAADLVTYWVVSFGDWLQKNFPTFVTLLLTAALVYFTRETRSYHAQSVSRHGDTAKAAKVSARNTHIVDRAYVKLSHTNGMYPDATGMFHVRMQARNTGRTPAKIENMMVKRVLLLNGEKLPAKPDYRRSQTEQRRAFLVANGSAYFSEVFSVPQEQLAEIRNGTRNLYLIGYADYVDVFGNGHRAGYARQYNPTISEGNNLTFVTAPGYDYDRPYRRRRQTQPGA